MGLNRVVVGDVCRTMTQGSSCLATLGFGTESRWDSRTERDSASRSRFASTEMVGCFRRNIACGSAAGRGHVERRKSKDPKVPIGTTESSPRFQPWVAIGEWPEPRRGDRKDGTGPVRSFVPDGTRFMFAPQPSDKSEDYYLSPLWAFGFLLRFASSPQNALAPCARLTQCFRAFRKHPVRGNGLSPPAS